MTDLAALPSAADPLYLLDLWDMTPGVVTYVNQGAFASVPLPVVRAERKTWRQLNAPDPMDFYRRGMAGELDQSWLAIARFLGSDEQGVALTQNTTTGIAAVLASLSLGFSGRILVTDHVYREASWNAGPAAQHTGAVVDEVPVDESPLLMCSCARFYNGKAGYERVTEALKDLLEQPSGRP